MTTAAPSKDQLLGQFMGATGSDINTARAALEANGWSLDNAILMHSQQYGGGQQVPQAYAVGAQSYAANPYGPSPSAMQYNPSPQYNPSAPAGYPFPAAQYQQYPPNYYQQQQYSPYASNPGYNDGYHNGRRDGRRDDDWCCLGCLSLLCLCCLCDF